MGGDKHLTTRGDIIKRGASNNEPLAIGSADTVLKSDGTDPAYGKIGAANVTESLRAPLRRRRPTWRQPRQRTCLFRHGDSTSSLGIRRPGEA
jgi:hypothetical protein